MKNIILKQFSKLLLISITLSISCLSMASASSLSSPLGYWKTIDDQTGDEKSILYLSESKSGEITAKVVKVLKTDDGSDPETRECDKCKGERKNQRIKGMTVMWGLTKTDDNEWSGGEILDPKTGSVYRVKFSLDETGKKLNVRGFLGFAMFGRTQVWHRLDKYTTA